MQSLFVIESRGQRVLTSAQIADCYNTTVDCIKQNFHANRNRYIEGKHYIALTGSELREFKNKVRISDPVKNESKNEVRIPHPAEIKARYQFDTQFKYAKSLYLWTEKGALLHAKSLNTDKAWEVYDYLVDFYFRAKEKQPEEEQKKEVVPVKCTTEQVKSSYVIPDMRNPMFILKNLLVLAEEENMKLEVKDLKGYTSMLHGDRIALRRNLTFEKAVYETAYELAHHFIHYNQGNIIESPLAKDYNEQAERAASMMIRMLDIKKSIA